MKKMLTLLILLAIAGAVCFVVFPEFNQVARDAWGSIARSGPVVASKADFTAGTTGGVDTLEVQFTDTSTIEGSGWTWSFGDDATHIAQNPKHRYTWPTDAQRAGKQMVTFDVTLRVDGPDGPATKSKVGFIKLYRPVRVDTVVAVTKPALARSAVTFESTVSGPPVEGYSWDFGDGETATGAGPQHIYAKPGTYVVTLTAASALPSNKATGTTNVTVLEPATLPVVVGLSIKEARGLLQSAGLKWRVTHAKKTPALVAAQQKLASTPQISGYKIQAFSGIRVPVANPAWAPANAACQQLKAAYDRELASGVWKVAAVRLPGGGEPHRGVDLPSAAKGSVLELICK